jgi:hypothetical protein
MSRVKVDIEEVDDVEDEHGRERDGVRAVCSRCDHKVESFGQTDRSRRRCLALLREECPNNEENYYADADDESGRPEDPIPKPWWEK